jgi:hypothetical protein
MHDHRKQSEEDGTAIAMDAGHVIRFGVSADVRLLEKFDEMIAEKCLCESL